MEWFGDSILAMKSSLYLIESQVSRKPRAHPMQNRHYIPPYTKKILEQGRANGLKFTSALPDVDYLFIYVCMLTHVDLIIVMVFMVISDETMIEMKQTLRRLIFIKENNRLKIYYIEWKHHISSYSTMSCRVLQSHTLRRYTF